jgi:two-component system, OmpR family, phosphate regulon response regulator OmpR
MNAIAPHILIVDDDDKLRALLVQFLNAEGFITTAAAHAQEARDILQLLTPDMVVLDVMMPHERGTVLAKQLRDGAGPPVLLLTALGEAEDRIGGLESGADDYLVKPFQPKELLLRIRNILSRTQKPVPVQRAVRFGAFVFYPHSGKLLHGDNPMYLTSSELGCLRALVEAEGKPVSRDILADASMEAHGGNARSVDVQINRLRKKIEANPSKPLYIQTVRHAGYALIMDGYVS